VSHVYQNGGVYTATVTFNPGSGQSVSNTASVTIAQGIQLNTNGPYTGQVGQNIVFSVAASGAPVDTFFTWDFGDGTSLPGPSVTKSYSSHGVFTVTLTARSNSTGLYASTTTTATIMAAPQNLSVTITGPSQGTAGAPLSFSANASGSFQGQVSYTWSFGDGTGQSTGQSVSHTFANPGTFTISVSGTTNGSPSVTDSDNLGVTVTPSGPTVSLPTGWNLIGAPTGTTVPQASGVLYTINASGAYDAVPLTQGMQGGTGYWAFFPAPAVIVLSGQSSTMASTPAPAGQWEMIGNPNATQSATVSGADVVYIYSPSRGSYQATDTLAPGQGAWAMSNAGGTIVITATQ
jgi:PKD repeat protein